MAKPPTVAALVAAAERHFHLAPGSLSDRDQSQPLASFRAITMFVAREAGYEYSWIGRVMGRDRSAVESAVRRARDMLAEKRHWWLYAKADLYDAWHDG